MSVRVDAVNTEVGKDMSLIFGFNGLTAQTVGYGLELSLVLVYICSYKFVRSTIDLEFMCKRAKSS